MSISKMCVSGEFNALSVCVKNCYCFVEDKDVPSLSHFDPPFEVQQF